jgi:predicted nucleotidyltransferase
MPRRRAASGHPKQMTVARKSPLRAQKSAIVAIARLHGAYRVRVFGSFARGQQTGRSDIDLLVDMEDGRTLLDLIALSRSLQGRLGRRVDVVTERSLSLHLRDRILAEARPI